MSIIIRLQNLPLSARSGDIRSFFGGLRIPDGGVHILGGDNGDAFIAFMSDEDARLAMRKDGGKIKGVRVKLFLSSYMEMQHEVEKITKSNFTNAPPHSTLNETTEAGFIRSRSSERRHHAHSHSPGKYDDWKTRPREYQRSNSPIIYNPKSSTSRYRSRSPIKPKSPARSYTSQNTPSKSRKFIQRKRSISPKRNDCNPHEHHLEEANNLSPVWGSSKYPKVESQFSSKNQLQSELEKRITDELEKNIAFRKVFDNSPASNVGLREDIPHRSLEFSHQNVRIGNMQNNIIFSPYASANSSVYNFQSDRFKQENLPFNPSIKFSKDEKGNQGVSNHFYVVLSGLEPDWIFREVQMILKGVFAPQYNIRWENKNGQKTGTVFVKLSNKEDFDSVLQKGVLYFKEKKITVKECPSSLIHKYFRPKYFSKSEHYISPDNELCYILKGLPFGCTFNDIVNFFHGLEIADIIIYYGEDGRATGTGFISFTNRKDFEGAMLHNGKKIGHRYIELLSCTNKEMAEAKKTYQGPSFVPYSKILSEKKSSYGSSLCAILTGLPLNTTTKSITSFFAESDLKPDAIHLILNKKKLCDGRAFVEFSNFLDFDLALKFHGKRFDNKIICVKQILHDEMVKILDSQTAMHHFKAPDHASAALNEPEKVPYLWEPPDEDHDKCDNSSVWIKDYKFGISSGPATKVHGNSSYGRPSFPSNNAQFYPSKQTTMNRPANEPFHSTKKYEENIKLSRLSPENEAALLDFLNKGRKPALDKRRPRDTFRNRNEKDSRLTDNRYDSPHRNILQPSPLPFESGGRSEDNKECVVQISNVNITAESLELLNFLEGFDFYTETLIRGYTSEGEPTPDVRVTFRNRWEAEKAIKMLNKTYLQGQKVNMFIV